MVESYLHEPLEYLLFPSSFEKARDAVDHLCAIIGIHSSGADELKRERHSQRIYENNSKIQLYQKSFYGNLSSFELFYFEVIHGN